MREFPTLTFSRPNEWARYMYGKITARVSLVTITAGVRLNVRCGVVVWCAQISLEYGSGPEDLLLTDSLLYRWRERIPPTQQSTKQTATAAAYKIRLPNLLGSHRLW